ncbi:MAG: 5-formyltetrahydrofolate cyclo-ligase [Treponema sp.]|nr:5-formyltetrahydrofolate cyclo-ligase [Treponema sp.]
MEKKEIRNQIKFLMKENLKKLDGESKLICEQILKSDAYKQCDEIFGYMALGDEVDVGTVLKKAFEDKKKVALPKVTTDCNGMDFYYVGKDFREELQNGYCGIEEPDSTREERVDLNKISRKVLFLVPGRAFTKNGKRLGRGKGFYDVFLGGIGGRMDKKTSVVAGVCFSWQIVEDLPVTATDVLMDMLFSADL